MNLVDYYVPERHNKRQAGSQLIVGLLVDIEEEERGGYSTTTSRRYMLLLARVLNYYLITLVEHTCRTREFMRFIFKLLFDSNEFKEWILINNDQSKQLNFN